MPSQLVDTIRAVHAGLRRLAPELAERLLRQATDLEPNRSHMHNNLGEVLRLSGNFDEAAQSYRKALGLAPSNPNP